MLAGREHVGLTVTASIGVAAGERACAEDFLRDADIAMHRAKWDGKDRHVVFDPGMQDSVQSRMELEMELRVALERDEFFLLYQPTFDLQGMMPTGVEALIRWRSQARGLVQPNDFIPLLEETGLIVEVGRWVLEEACRQGASWREAGRPVGVAVNVSARQLETDQFVGDVRTALARSGLPARALTLEITETALMRNPEQTARRLHAIKELGVRDRDRRLRHRLLLVRPPANSFPSTRSRSTARSSPSSARTPKARRSCARSCSSARRCRWRPSPRASSCTTSCRCCATSAVTAARASCSRAR